jgi:hypothetical protein
MTQQMWSICLVMGTQAQVLDETIPTLTIKRMLARCHEAHILLGRHLRIRTLGLARAV